VVRVLNDKDLADVVLWVRRGGFPGDYSDADLAAARRLIDRNPGIHAVVIALGGGSFLQVDRSAQENVVLRAGGEEPGNAGPQGFKLGTGDGATLPGIPVSWRLLRLNCPQGDTTLLVARYPASPPVCPEHGIALELDEAAP
jgi:hypothetical protein